jgi:hypothetical protein
MVPAGDADRVVDIAARVGYAATVGGTVTREQDRKAVELRPLGITYAADSLHIR